METKQVLIWVAILSSIAVSSTLLYCALKRNEENEHDENSSTTVSQLHVVRKFPIPKAAVGSVIGKYGSVIKDISKATDTSIHFESGDDENHKTIIMKGSLDGIEAAKIMVNKILDEYNSLCTVEKRVSARSAGRVIGKHGNNIRAITEATKAKINIHSDPDDINDEKTLIIRGQPDQVEKAVALIEKSLEPEKGFCNGPDEGASADPDMSESSTENNDMVQVHMEGKLIPTSDDGYIEVFVSSVHSPNKFWVQVVNSCLTVLDRMTDSMTMYYNKQWNRQHNTISQLSVGDVVAAPFAADGSWYRAKVIGVNKNESIPDETEVHLMYGDFGDGETHRLRDLLLLKKQFMKLPFQALECTLSNIKPIDEHWSEEAIDFFEKLVHAARWKVIIAKVDSHFTQDNKVVNSVTLYDTNKSKDIKIAEELIKSGYAVEVSK